MALSAGACRGGFTWIASIGVMLFAACSCTTHGASEMFRPDDYVMAAVSIYLDLLNMFLSSSPARQQKELTKSTADPFSGEFHIEPGDSPR